MSEDKNEDKVSISMSLTVAGFKELLARPEEVLDKVIRREGDLVMKLYTVVEEDNLYIVAAESKVQARKYIYTSPDSLGLVTIIDCIGYPVEGTKAGIMRRLARI